MRLLALLLAAVFLTGLVAAYALKPVHLCYNSPNETALDVSFGKAGLATDHDISTGLPSDLTIDLGQATVITDYNLTLTTATGGCGDSSYIFYSNNGVSWIDAGISTNSINYAGPVATSFVGEIMPAYARYWKITATNYCPGQLVLEVNLSSVPQYCRAKFTQLVSANGSGFDSLYNDYSLNSSKNQGGLVYELANGSVYEAARNFQPRSDYPLAAFDAGYRSVWLHESTAASGNCAGLILGAFYPGLDLIQASVQTIYSGWYSAQHAFAAAYNGSHLFLEYNQVPDCSWGGANQVRGRIINASDFSVLSDVAFAGISELNQQTGGVVSGAELPVLEYATKYLMSRPLHFSNQSVGARSNIFTANGTVGTHYYFGNGSFVLFSSNEGNGTREVYAVQSDCNDACAPIQITNDSAYDKNVTSVLDLGDYSVYAYVRNDSNSSFYDFVYIQPYSSDAFVNSTNASSAALLSLRWRGITQLKNYTISTNNSGAWVNYSGNASGIDAFVNASVTINDSVGYSVGWTSWAWSENGTVRQSPIYSFVVTDAGAPNWSSASVNTTCAGRTAEFSLDWVDDGNLAAWLPQLDSGNGSVTGNVTWFSGSTNNSRVYFEVNATVGVLRSINVTANDSAGNANSSSYSFNSTDCDAPTISSLSVSVNASSAVITFSTDEPANQSASASGVLASNASYSLSHLALLTGLNSSATYRANVTACDSSGNCATDSAWFTTSASPTPTPAPPQGGNPSGGGFFSPVTVDSFPTPTATPTTYASPSPSPITSVIPALLAPTVSPLAPPDIRVQLNNDSVEIYVLSEGKPVNGSVRLRGPGEKSYELPLDNGSAVFAPDASGDWTVSYGGVEKKFHFNPSPIVPSSATGFAVGWPSYYFGLALVVLAALVALGFAAQGSIFKRGPSIERVVAGEVVTIKILNRGGRLTSVVLSDLVQSQVADSGGAVVKETTLGRLVQWTRPVLEHGGAWSVSYRLVGAQDGASGSMVVLEGVGESGKLTRFS